MTGAHPGISHLLGLAGLVASGAVLPFVPTGAAVSVAGRAVFPEPWQGVTAGIARVLLVSLAGVLWNRWALSGEVKARQIGT